VTLVFCAGLLAQTSDPAFDAASIKLSPPMDSSHGPIWVGAKGGPGTDDPGRYSCTFCTVSGLISDAYDVPDYRLASSIRLPADRFHVEAAIPAGTTKEQFRSMLQSLLAERFKLAVHTESREMQTFRLIVAPGGPKLSTHVDGEPLEAAKTSRNRNRAPGYYYQLQGRTVGDFAKLVEGQLRRPVTDATGLNGKYDFDVWWTTDDLNADAQAPTDAPTLRSVIQSLGLKLESRKESVEVVVVDRVERLPTEN
jgi:uncharacterized protein (TIGR03435 family)